jgi:hypothetical protein
VLCGRKAKSREYCHKSRSVHVRRPFNVIRRKSWSASHRDKQVLQSSTSRCLFDGARQSSPCGECGLIACRLWPQGLFNLAVRQILRHPRRLSGIWSCHLTLRGHESTLSMYNEAVRYQCRFYWHDAVRVHLVNVRESTSSISSSNNRTESEVWCCINSRVSRSIKPILQGLVGKLRSATWSCYTCMHLQFPLCARPIFPYILPMA